jgi:hypothetical protein
MVRTVGAIVVVSLGLVGSISAKGVSGSGSADQAIDWDKVIIAHDAYIDDPSPENARVFLASLPRDRPDKTVGNERRALETVFSGDTFWIIQNEAVAGERGSVEILFRLLNIADGHDSEVVESALGILVRNRPALFLNVLSSYRETYYIRTDGYPVYYVGFGYNDRPGPQRHELEKRIEALRSVKEPRLAEIRDGCIQRLHESLSRLPK